MSEDEDTTEELEKMVLATSASHGKGNGKFYSKDKSSKGKGKSQNRKHLDAKELERRRDNNLCFESTHKMSPAELDELRKQQDELLTAGYIEPTRTLRITESIYAKC